MVNSSCHFPTYIACCRVNNMPEGICLSIPIRHVDFLAVFCEREAVYPCGVGFCIDHLIGDQIVL